MNASEFWVTVNVLCKVHGGTVTSGIRSKDRNHMVGGSPRSKHLMGIAADVVLDDMALIYRDGFVHAAKKVGLSALDEADHIHLQGLPPGVV